MHLAFAAALLTGRLLTADGQPATGMRVVIDWSGGRATLGASDTLSVDAAGRFGTLARPAGDSVAISVRGAAYAEVRVVVSVARVADEIHIALVPRRWAIRVGEFAGDTVPISIEAALRRAPDRGSFGRTSRERLVGWGPGSFPLAVVLRRDDGQRIAPGDSSAFWQAARALERAIGADFFRPAMDTMLRGRAYPVDIRIDARVPGAGITFVSWDRDGNIFEASVRFHSSRDMRDAGIVEHELLHVLGFGHTSAWPSLLEPRARIDQRISAEDVAYAQLLTALHEMTEDPLVVGGIGGSGAS